MANRIILNETSYFGAGAIREIVPEVRGRGAKKVLVVTDNALMKAQVATKVTQVLDEGGVAYEVYDKIKPNPTIENVQEGVAACKAAGADIIVAIGGGSAIDTSKAIAIIMTNPEFSDVRSLEGASPTKHKALPIIAVSTTSGTAAEVTINYVITDTERHRKFVCADPHDIPVVAIVDEDMVMSMPPKLCASTGMDALVHAIEGFITKGAWELTDMMHIKAIEIIAKNLRASVKGDRAARGNMALGQYIAGMGFSNVGLGIDHSMAHPLSAVYDIPHGMACAILLAPVHCCGDGRPRHGDDDAGGVSAGRDRRGAAGRGRCRHPAPSLGARRQAGGHPVPRAVGDGGRLHAGQSARRHAGGHRGDLSLHLLSYPHSYPQHGDNCA